jgi:hypothetical protein
MSPANGRFARPLFRALALLALFCVSTGQVGSCAPDRRGREVQSVPPGQMPQGLRYRTLGGGFGQPVTMHVRVSPSPARIGQALHYRAHVFVGPNQKVRFEPPQSGGEFTWSELRAGRSRQGVVAMWRHGKVYGDSVWFEARLQVFATGLIEVPGLRLRLDPAPNSSVAGSTRLPTARVMITPTVTSADSNQALRGLHGPIGAPWWERVPVAAIVAGLALLGVWVFVLRKLRRRVRKPVRRAPSPVAASVRPRLDPAAEALRALFTLRAKKLPAQQRCGEHALELTAILRRFLEATVSTPRPGDTSGELLERLRASRTEPADLERLEGLLGLWDRVKFARAPLTEVEATRCEEAVEGYVRRVAQARLEAEAAAARAAAARTAAAAASSGGRKPPPPPTAGSSSSSMRRPSSGSMPRPPVRPGSRPPAPEVA